MLSQFASHVSDKASRLYDLIANSQAGRAMQTQALIQAEQERLASRTAARIELDRATAADTALVKGLAKDEPALLETIETCKRASKEAVDALIERRRQAAIARGPHEYVQGRMRALLETSASPLIEAFCERLPKVIEATWESSDRVQKQTIDGGYRTTWDNGSSVRVRVEAISALRHEARALVMEAIDDVELTKRLDALEAALPEVERRPRRFFGGN